TGATADRGQRRVRRRRPRRADPLGPAAPARWRPGRRAPRLRTRPLRRVTGRAPGPGRRPAPRRRGGARMTTAATGAAKDQVARLLRLVPYLHARDQVSLDEAAQALGVPPAQLEKDLRVLFLCGLPGGYPDDLIDVDLDALEGEGLIRVSNADYLARPLRLTPTEATAIIVALRALRAGADGETRGVVDRALAKLEEAAAGAQTLVDPGDDVASTLALRGRLEDATRRRRQVRLTYYVPARDEESERVVDPHRVVSHHGVDYLDAWCHSADAPRLFRLDRIHEAHVLDSAVVTEPAQPRDLSAGMFASGEEATLVT